MTDGECVEACYLPINVAGSDHLDLSDQHTSQRSSVRPSAFRTSQAEPLAFFDFDKMVDPRVPLWVRSGTLLAAFIAFATGSAGYIRSCQFGSDVYGSKNQVNFMIAMGVLSFIVLAIRIIVCDVRQCVRGNRKVFLAIEIVFAFLTFVAGIAGSAAPVSSAVCSDAENKEFMEEVCEFKCSNILAAIVSNFFMCMGFLISLLFTYNPALITTTAEEDFTFGETPPTPRTHKINNANSTNV